MTKCSICNQDAVQEQLVETWMQRGNQWVLFKSVPAMVCRQCGDKSFSQDTAERLAKILDPDSHETPTAFQYLPEFDLALMGKGQAQARRLESLPGTSWSEPELPTVRSPFSPVREDSNEKREVYTYPSAAD